MGTYEEEEQSTFQKYRVILGCGLAAVIAVAAWFGQRHSTRASRPRPEQNVILVNLPPPPPVAPAPRPPSQSPPPPVESQQKMIEQAPVNETETKPVEASRAESPSSDSAALGTSIQGSGPPDGFGLRGAIVFGGSVGGTGTAQAGVAAAVGMVCESGSKLDFSGSTKQHQHTNGQFSR